MKHKITESDIVVFFRQFAVLVSANVPILRSCDLLLQSQQKIIMREIIRQFKKELLSGKTLNACLKLYPKYFSELVCSLIMISEHTGRLDTMLTLVANHLEKQQQFKKRIQQALFYPCLVCLVGITTTIAMLLFIVPRFADLFQDVQDKLPLVTRAIFFISFWLREYLQWVGVGIIILLVVRSGSRAFARDDRKVGERDDGKVGIKNRRIQWRSILVKFPIIKPCWQSILLTRFTRNLAMTLSAGITITDALKISANAVGDKSFANTIASLTCKIHSGLSLHQTIENHLPILMTQMIKIGEESGMLETMLDKLADLYQSDADHLLSQLNQALEPLIMLVLGALIGGLVISMYLPIFNLGSTL